MKWNDCKSYIEILLPNDFSYEECLIFLGRSSQEICHSIQDGYLFKLLKMAEELYLLKISCFENHLHVEFPLNQPPQAIREHIAGYVGEWFDLDRDLKDFYNMAKKDHVLKQMVDEYKGLRIIGIPDLFEALTWAIIGQQINLAFAYTLKKRFVEKYGEGLWYKGKQYWLFPTYEKVSTISVGELRELSFTERKAEYIIGVAKLMANGELSKETLLLLQDNKQVHQLLLRIRGVGAWTADYVMMKCLHVPSAFPVADAGLHQALKKHLGYKRKLTIDEIRGIATNWEGWEAYATFYLWRSLYE